MNVLLGSRSMNEYWQQVALALHEAGALGRYRTGYVDPPTGPLGRLFRNAAAIVPPLDRALSARRMSVVPRQLVLPCGAWDLARAAAGRMGVPTLLEDWLFCHGEMRFDAGCAADFRSGTYDAVLTTEFGALDTIRAARQMGRRSVVGFVSPHHRFREKWVDAAVSRQKGLMTHAKSRLMRLAKNRDLRRDHEMQEADFVLSCSPLVSRTLREAGVPGHRILTVMLGCPDPVLESDLAGNERERQPLRVMYAGLLAAHKGVSYLLDAWKKLGAGSRAQLDLYGLPLLPAGILRAADASVRFHGAVTRDILFDAYRQADILVFPSLCDGFGAVVTEAFSRGLPAIVSENAGASALVRDGDNGFVAPPADAPAIAEKLSWCLSHRRELVAMRRAALETARARGWSVFRDELRRSWQPVLEKAA